MPQKQCRLSLREGTPFRGANGDFADGHEAEEAGQATANVENYQIQYIGDAYEHRP
jgi:hypothetical protein